MEACAVTATQMMRAVQLVIRSVPRSPNMSTEVRRLVSFCKIDISAGSMAGILGVEALC